MKNCRYFIKMEVYRYNVHQWKRVIAKYFMVLYNEYLYIAGIYTHYTVHKITTFNKITIAYGPRPRNKVYHIPISNTYRMLQITFFLQWLTFFLCYYIYFFVFIFVCTL